MPRSFARSFSVAAAVSAARLLHGLIHSEPIHASGRPGAGTTRTTGNGKRNRSSSCR
jgi:hypothetical protein